MTKLSKQLPDDNEKQLSGNSRCMHLFTLPEDLVRVRKIKPQRSQRITESCYFHLSSPLCHSVSSVVFQNLTSKISKVSGVLVAATRDIKDPEKLQPLVGEISWSMNLILMVGGKDNLKREFYHAYRDLPKVQPPVAQIGWTHNLIVLQRCQEPFEHEPEDLNSEVATLAATIKKNFEELGI